MPKQLEIAINKSGEGKWDIWTAPTHDLPNGAFLGQMYETDWIGYRAWYADPRPKELSLPPQVTELDLQAPTLEGAKREIRKAIRTSFF